MKKILALLLALCLLVTANAALATVMVTSGSSAAETLGADGEQPGETQSDDAVDPDGQGQPEGSWHREVSEGGRRGRAECSGEPGRWMT